MPKQDVFHRTEAAMGMTPQVWARHSNPWSGWSRLTVLPLLALAVWSRIWLGWGALGPILLVLVWTWLNPRIFATPRRTDNWMSRGVLGEQIWLRQKDAPELQHHRPVVRMLTFISGAGGLIYLLGLILLSPGLTFTGLAAAMLGKLWMLDRMVWISEDAARCKIDHPSRPD